MKILLQILLICTLIALGITGCDGGAVEGGYTPPGIPVRISVNSHGEVSLGASNSWATPYGTFDVGYGGSVHSLRNQYAARLLIVRVNNQATVYELEEGKEFHIEFDDSNKLYRRVALNYESDGDIVLELESVGSPVSGGGSTVAGGSSTSGGTESCEKALPSKLFVGANAKVVTFQLKGRDAPGFDSYSEHTLAEGRIVTVLEGPVCADDAWWWRIHFAGTVSTGKSLEYDAWMVEVDNDTYYLRETP